MGHSVEGFYVNAAQLQRWLGRLEELAGGIQALQDEMRAAECVQIQVAPYAKVANQAASPVATQSPRKAAPVSAQDVLQAKARLEASAEPVAAHEAETPALTRELKPAFGRAKRIPFARYREQLTIDHGREVTDYMVELCGKDRCTKSLRRLVKRFIGTFSGPEAAKSAWSQAVGLTGVEGLSAEDVLGQVRNVLHHEDGQVSVFADPDHMRTVGMLRARAEKPGAAEEDAAKQLAEAV